MTKRISIVAMLACIAGSLAFSQSTSKLPETASSEKTPAATDRKPDMSQKKEKGSPQGNKKKINNEQKPPASKEQQEFQHLLQGIYG